MKKTTKVLGAAASAAIFAAGAAVSAPAVQAMDGNTSLASVLDVGNAEFDHSSKDFDILTTAAEAVLAAKPDSPVALLADGDTALTVFAPTDKAFAKLPKGTVETLLKPENKDKLVAILTYHVVSGKVMSKTAVTLDKATALSKKDIALAVKGQSLTLNGSAKVIKADIECSNGVIHVIDTVILPPSK